MSTIAVCPLSKLPAILKETGAARLVSLLSPDMEFSRPDTILAENHLILRFNDIVEPQGNLVLPSVAHIDELLQFANNWDQARPMVVHCWAGVSRSPAAATIIAIGLFPEMGASGVAGQLRKLSPVATPNIRMIELADARLGLGGRFESAIRMIGRGVETAEGDSFLLRLKNQ